MTPEEAEVLKYLTDKDWASTHQLARRLRKGLATMELAMRSLLSHGQVEEDAKRYYRITERGRKELADFDSHWEVKPFDGKRRII